MSKNYGYTTQLVHRQKRTSRRQDLYGWACERLYTDFAWSYDWVSWLVSLGRWSAWRALALDYVVGQQILEIGFGTGELLLLLAQRDAQVVGLEVSTAMQRQVTRKLCRRGLTIPRLQARAQATGLATATFDTIISTFPAPYILDSATLAECWRLLRPSGRLVIVFGVAAGPRTWHRLIPLFYSPASATWQRTLQQRFAAAGFAPTFVARVEDDMVVHIIVAEAVPPAATQP